MSYATRTIVYTVTGQHIDTPVAEPAPVGDTLAYLLARFALDNTWDGLTVMAVFRAGEVIAEPVLLDDDHICPVPPVVLEKPAKEFCAGLIGFNADGYRLTTDEAGVDLDRSCYRAGQTPSPPTPDVYAALLTAIADKLPLPAKAEPGQVIAVEEVDEDGRVTKTKAVTPSDGGGSGTGDIPVMTADTIGGAKLGNNLKIDAAGRLSVDTTDTVAGDNTKPITAAAVYATVGNIEILLNTI